MTEIEGNVTPGAGGPSEDELMVTVTELWTLVQAQQVRLEAQDTRISALETALRAETARRSLFVTK